MMVNKYNRLQIPKEFRVFVKKGGDERISIYIFYSTKEQLYYISSDKDDYIDEYSYITHIKMVDNKWRITLSSDIIQQYGTCNIICGMRNNVIFLIPLEEA